MISKKKNRCAIAVLSVLVFVSTFCTLITPAESRTNIPICGNDEHIHTNECFELCNTSGKTVLVCNTYNDSIKPAHIHDSFCYDGNSLICPLEEYKHTHNADCYDENNTIICGTEFHQHSEQCFSNITESGTAEILVCGKKAHVHTLQCDEIQSVAVSADNPEAPEIPEINETAYNDAVLYESVDVPAPLSDDIDISSAVDMTQYITAVALRYKDDLNNWIAITGGNNTDMPANREYRIDVSYKINDIGKLDSNKLVLENKIPLWITPTDTNLIYDDEIAGFIAVKNGTLVITFNDGFMSTHSGELRGSFYVYGNADWHKVNTKGETIDLPTLDVKVLHFENNLPEKYGKATVEKSVDKQIVTYGNKNYLKYTLTVKSAEKDFDIKNIAVRDNFTENGTYIKYAEISADSCTLGNTQDGVKPYESGAGESGTVVLDNGDMVWNIGTLKADETRVLTYYAELDNSYTGAEAKGTISNKADLFSGEYPKDSAESSFIPVANLNVTKKTDGNPDIDETGSGTISYEVRVVSWANNSYTLKNVRINDVIDPKYKDFVEANAVEVSAVYQEIKDDVIINTRDISAKLDYSDENSLFSYNIPELKAGDAVVLTYTIRLKNILTAENSDINFKNTADIYLDGNKSENGKVFKSSFVDYTIHQSSWIRKISGVSLDDKTTVSIDGNNIYNYNGTEYSSPPSSFEVPKNSRQYQIIVNEGGAWNLSSATLHDNFQQINGTDYMKYSGFLRIEEFSLSESDRTSIKSSDDNGAISLLTGLQPEKTVWVDIGGKTSFDLIPSAYGLDNNKHTYLLTYYAQPQNVENIGSISVTNDFTIYGDIGNGAYITAPGILCSVSNTVSGAIHYNASKEPWYLTDDPEELKNLQPNYSDNGGALYWIIKVDGTVNAGFSIDDIPVNNTTGFTNHEFCRDSVAGVFKGAKDIDITADYSKYDDLLADSQNFTKLTGNDSNFLIGHDELKFKYRQIDITDINQLDGKSFIIANINENNKAIMGNTEAVNGYTTGIAKEINLNIASSQWATGSHIMGMPAEVKWTFEKQDGNKFYISNGGKYLNINGNQDGKVSMSDTPVALNVSLSSEKSGQICISNGNFLLTWAGGGGNNQYFSAWSGGGNSRQLSLIEPTGDDYLWTSQTGYKATITFQHDIPLTDDEALYIVIRTVNSTPQNKTSHTNNRYGNQFQVNDIIKGTSGVMNQVEYIHRLAGSVLKTGKAAYSYDGKEWSVAYEGGNLNRLNNVWSNRSRSGIVTDGNHYGESNNTPAGVKSIKDYVAENYGPGTYAEWYVYANWDGTLSGTADIYDTLPDNFEPVCVTLYEWGRYQSGNPQYPAIDELDNNNSWQKNTIEMYVKHFDWTQRQRTFNYYYNPATNELRWRIENLVNEDNIAPSDMPHPELQNYNNSLGFVVICKVKDPEILMNGTSSIAENNVTIQAGSFTDSDNDIICINGGTSLRKHFETGNIVSDSGNNTYEISSAKIPFVIEVNPFAEKLSADGKLPPLIDVMGAGLEIDASSIKIEYQDGTAVQGCSYIIDGQTMTFSGLPDEKAVRITYRAKINNLNSSNTEAYISNTAYWYGYDMPENPQIDKAKMMFRMGGEITLSAHPKLTVIKTEKGNSSKFLANAEFQLLDSNKNVIATKTTDNSGKITFYQHENGSYMLNYNEIYYLKETSAPSGYELDETEKCIVILDNARDNDKYNNLNDVLFWESKIYGDECEYICGNEKKKIRLEKVFEDGTTPTSGTYSFGIYEGNNLNSTPVQILSIEYSENSEPVYLLNGVAVKSPEFTCAETGIAYYIYELCDGKPVTNGSTININGHSFEVSYTNDNFVSLKSNVITVTNRFIYYEMPETGGKGTSIFYVISISVIAVGVMMIIIKKIRQKAHS